MAAEFHPSDEAPSETDRPQLIQPPRPQVPTSTISAAEVADPHMHKAMQPSTATTGVRVRERRLSSTPSAGSSVAHDVGAPVVWATPDWAAHPVIESYYGHARRARENSFYEVMQSPTNTLATRTLAESCNSYDRSEASDDNEDDADAGDSHGEDGRRGHLRRGHQAPTQKLGSFSFSYTTETSDDLVDASPSFSASSAESGYELHPRVRASTMATIASVAGSGRADSGGHKAATAATPRKTLGHSGYANWNRKRLPTDLVPVPHPAGRMKTPAATLDTIRSAAREYIHDEDHPQPADIGNPQGGHAGDASSSEDPESPTHARNRAARTSGRLRSKLQECRAQIDERIQIEAAFARDAHACLTRSTAAAAADTKRESLMWSLLCGANTSSSSASFGGSSKSGLTNAFDGIDFLHDRLAVAVHHRALNQLQRHRRHVNGILQIVTSHNPDLGLTERQLDSFESADAMLANDVKYLTLSRQVAALLTTRRKRVDARRHATIQNGRDCFESSRVKRAMLAKLLEAVSWYRLVQTNAREESASTSVGLSVEAAAVRVPIAGLGAGVANPDGHEASLSSGSSSSSSRSSLSASRSLQELQVERILSVLAGEEFYSDYNELMCQPDWWEIAQAHFENIVFSTPDSRVAQWVQRVSRDVAAVCFEPLEDESSYLRLDEKKSKTSRNANPVTKTATQPPAEWTKDPQPEQILEFVDRVTRRIRKELDVPNDVTKSLNVFVQRLVFPRLALLCFNQKTLIDCQRKDKLWRKQCVDLSGIPLENLNVGSDLAGKIRSKLPCRRVAGGRRAFLIHAIDAFNCMTSVVPCDLLDELMYGVVILHHEAALVLGTTQFSVETFFPLLTYVLLHCNLPTIHAQLHLLENYAITHSNANGEESYYVYCVHAAVEYVCNSSGLTTTPPPPPSAPTAATSDESLLQDTAAPADPVDVCNQDGLSAVASAVPAVAAV